MALFFTVSLRIPALPLFQPGQAAVSLGRELQGAMLGIVAEIATEARRRTPVFTGVLRASIGTRVTLGQEAGSLVLGEVFTGAEAPYAVYVEEGTRPHWPPRAPIEFWAQKVLGDRALWFVVARAIARRGTKAHHMFRDAMAQVQPTLASRLQAAVDRAAQALMAEGR